MTNRLPPLALLVLSTTLFGGVIGYTQPVQAQSVIAYIRVISGLSANVRSCASADCPTVQNSLTFASGEFAAIDKQGDWYRLLGDTENGNQRWVSSTYNGGRNALLTVRGVAVTVTPAPTQTKTQAVTPTPSRIVPTATIAGLQTITPHPTIDPYMVYDYGRDGKLESVTVYCYEPCQWVLNVENLP